MKASLFASLLNDERGSSIVINAVAMVMALGLAALAIDMGNAYVIRNEMQSTADATALAAASQLPNVGLATNTAIEYAHKNLDPAVHGNVLSASDVVPGTWDKDTSSFVPNAPPLNAVQVTLRRTSDNGNAKQTFFARALGHDSLDIAVTAVAARESNILWDIVIVQDVTGSFTAEIADARDANQALLDCLKDFTFAEPRVGIVSFNGEARTVKPILPIATGYGQLSAAVSSIETCHNDPAIACSGTNIAAGMTQASGLINVQPPIPNKKKGMVIVSDGYPEVAGIMQPYGGGLRRRQLQQQRPGRPGDSIRQCRRLQRHRCIHRILR